MQGYGQTAIYILQQQESRYWQAQLTAGLLSAYNQSDQETIDFALLKAVRKI